MPKAPAGRARVASDKKIKTLLDFPTIIQVIATALVDWPIRRLESEARWALKNGVAKVSSLTSIPCSIKTRADNKLSNPPEKIS